MFVNPKYRKGFVQSSQVFTPKITFLHAETQKRKNSKKKQFLDKALRTPMFAVKFFHADLANYFYRNNKTKISAKSAKSA